MSSTRVPGWASRLERVIRASVVSLGTLGTVWAADSPAPGGRRAVDPRGGPAAGMTPLPTTLPQADAGDDAIGMVGRRVTLNGRASTPAGRIGFRWIQVEGPPVGTRREESDLLTFLPEAPGVYRFALVVAEAGVISQPDFAAVLVVPEAPLSEGSPAAARLGPTGRPPPPGPEEAARVALAALEDGPPAAKALAAAFEDIAGRIDLYSTYADILQGTTSRLEPVLPTDPARRAAWNERLFIPLTNRLIDSLRPVGLDLARPEGLDLPLSADHRTRLAQLFRAMARGFRLVIGQ